jgi:hypothetical protein
MKNVSLKKNEAMQRQTINLSVFSMTQRYGLNMWGCLHSLNHVNILKLINFSLPFLDICQQNDKADKDLLLVRACVCKWKFTLPF